MTKDGKRLFFLIFMFSIYLAILSYGLFFAESMNRSISHVSSYNNVPFREIGRILAHGDILGWRFVLINLGGNIIAFLPFGFFISAIFQNGSRLHPLALVCLAFCFSTVVEYLQYKTGVGVADIDDIILNTFGAFLGFIADSLIQESTLLQGHRALRKGIV